MSVNKIFFPEIIIGVPTADSKEYCKEKFFENLSNFSYPNKKIVVVSNDCPNPFLEASYIGAVFGVTMKRVAVSTDRVVKFVSENNEVEFAFINPKTNQLNERIAHSHNYLAQKAIFKNQPLLHLESDIIAPTNAIEELVIASKPIVGGLYQINFADERQGMFYFKEQHGEIRYAYCPKSPYDAMEITGDPIEVFHCGLGCVLIQPFVLKKITFRTEKGSGIPPDSFFYADCDKNKIPVWLHTGVICDHLNQSWTKTAAKKWNLV
jgi:hypothetical protein